LVFSPGVADHIAPEDQIIGIKLEEKAAPLQLYDNQIEAATRVKEERPAGY